MPDNQKRNDDKPINTPLRRHLAMSSGTFILVEHKPSKSLKYKNLTKSRCGSSNMICKNAFSISAENAYLCKRNCIKTPNKLSVSDGPGNKKPFRDGLFPVFELAS